MITQLRTNRLKNPLGFWLGTPSVSWLVQAQGTEQRAARVEVSLDPNFARVLYDTGMSAELDSICTPLPIGLSPRTRYYWRVTVETDAGETLRSEAAFFETAKLGEPWRAEWITPDFPEDWHAVMHCDFMAEKPVTSARAYVSGLGIYEISLNGQKVGDEYLSPGLCAYDKWLPYQTYDVDLLGPGENRVEITLGNGWYKGRYGLERSKEFHYGEELACLCEIAVTYEDGEEVFFVTSPENWRARRSPVIASSIFDGETRDDAMTDETFYPVKAISLRTPEERRSPPVRIMRRLRPVEILRTPAGETVLDMGQNMVGWLAFECAAPKGEEIRLEFGEVLQGGNFYRDNLRTALCQYNYTSDGVKKTVRPSFTFYGFRYVKLTKWCGEVRIEDFEGLALYSDMEETGKIVTSNAKVNRLFENALWGQRGNFLDVPTDCPQRDERMGWTGDAQVFFGTAAFNMDVYAFFTKYCHDLMLEQKALGGIVPVVIPKHDVWQAGVCAWGDAATIIPWNMYVRYGDKEILKGQYPSMKAWVDYIRGRDEAAGGKRLWIGDFHYGDWLSLDSEDPIGYRFGGTEHVYLASCFYRYSARLVAKAAAVLGNEKDAALYEALSEEVRGAILAEYLTESGRLALTTQTAYVLALFMDILPPEHREKNARALTQKLKLSEFHLRTGFIGTPYLCRVLSNCGANDIAYRLLVQEDFPSWLYQVNMGATTIWERWNSILPDGSISDTGMNSLNHYSYGSVIEWLYRDAAGINPVEEHPGFRRFTLEPKPHWLLGSLSAEFDAPTGKIVSKWEILQDGSLSFYFRVPFGAKAELTLPDCPIGYPRELRSGEYEFTYMPASPLRPVINLDTPINEVLKNENAGRVLREELPEFTGMMLFSMLAGAKSINDFIHEGYLSLSPNEKQKLEARLQAAEAL